MSVDIKWHEVNFNQSLVFRKSQDMCYNSWPCSRDEFHVSPGWVKDRSPQERLHRGLDYKEWLSRWTNTLTSCGGKKRRLLTTESHDSSKILYFILRLTSNQLISINIDEMWSLGFVSVTIRAAIFCHIYRRLLDMHEQDYNRAGKLLAGPVALQSHWPCWPVEKEIRSQNLPTPGVMFFYCSSLLQWHFDNEQWA